MIKETEAIIRNELLLRDIHTYILLLKPLFLKKMSVTAIYNLLSWQKWDVFRIFKNGISLKVHFQISSTYIYKNTVNSTIKKKYFDVVKMLGIA